MHQYVRPRVSYADLERWPEDGKRYELYDGEVVVVPAPIPRHQRVAFKIAQALVAHEEAVGGLAFGSPIDIVFDDYNVVQPDAVFFSRERLGAIDMRRAIRIPPDLAVEVLSPSTAAIDRGRKMASLAKFGVPEYWIVDPIDNTVEQYLLEGARYRLHARLAGTDEIESARLPGLKFPAARIFGF